MHTSLRASLTGLFAASTVAALVLAWHATRRPTAVTVWLPIVACDPVQADPIGADWGTDPSGRASETCNPGLGTIDVGHLDLSWLPGGTVKAVGREATEDLLARMKEWSESESFRPMIDPRKAVVFARTADPDRIVSAENRQECGAPVEWLLEVLHQRLAGATIVCDRNVCRIDGEGAPDDYLVFDPIKLGEAPDWALVAWLQVSPGASLRDTGLPAASRCLDHPVDRYW